MRKLPKVTYGKSKYLDSIGADGVFDICKKTIEIRKEMLWNDEMRVFVHEVIHWVEIQYKDKVATLGDAADLNKNEVDKMAKKICRMIVKAKYKKLFK